MGDLSQLDAGQGGIDWNGVVQTAVSAGATYVLQQQQQNQTPVPYVSPVQVAQPVVLSGNKLLMIGAGLVIVFLLLRR